MSLVAKFWSRVKRGNPNSCWNWTGGRFVSGYGKFLVRGKTYRAHRVAFVLANRQNIPARLCICHTCDNPRCCNPAHLWLGTHLDNMRDMIAKGRWRPHYGERHGNATLTLAQVLRIDWLHRVRGFSQNRLARLFNVTQSTIWGIVNERAWVQARAAA
jgi:HNH endonuclease